jgi:MbtH protein
MFDSEEDERCYLVVVNHEAQYSLWPKEQALPPGWDAAGKEGRRAECLAHIDAVWTDMRPLSLRRQMAAQAGLARSTSDE